MSICGTCGRQRDGDSRFCGTCGTEYADSDAMPAADGSTGESATRIDGPTGGSNPFASWYQPPGGLSEGPGRGPAAEHQPTQTVLPSPGAGGYQIPAAPPGGFDQPGPGGYQGPPGYQAPAGYPGAQPGPPGPPYQPAPPADGPQRGGPRGLLIALAVVVVLAAGGGAYALATSLGKHSTAQPSPPPTVSASTPGGGTAPASSPAGSAPASSASPSPTISLVAIGPGVTGSVDPSVQELLSHYFHGINTRDYAEYAGTLNAAERSSPDQSPSKFQSGYETTTDSGMTLTSLATTSGAAGGLTATVSFTSRQSPSTSVDHSACNQWTLNLYLVPAGSGYLIGPAPKGYQPDYSDC